MTASLLILLTMLTLPDDLAWSEAALVRQGVRPVVHFQACFDSGYLIVRATHEEGWHTYAMDNAVRATEALKGQDSLGIEQGIEVKVESGLELQESWLQSKPADLSQPELLWFTYGFEKQALFACPVKNVNGKPVVVRIRGQACNQDACSMVDVVLELEVPKDLANGTPTPDPERLKKRLGELVPVQSEADAKKQGS